MVIKLDSQATTGELNTIIGTIAGRDNITGSRNTYIGDSAGSGPSGDACTYVGIAAGALSGGKDNTFIGDSAGANNAAGNNNCMLGVGAGVGSTGSDNIFIGYFAGASETGSNKLHIDNTNTATPLIYGDFSSNSLSINGKLTATGLLDAKGGIYLPNAFGPDNAYVGNAGNAISFGDIGNSEDFLGYANNTFYFRDSPGGADVAQPAVYAASFPTYSSRRWKHDIQDLTNPLEIIKQLRGVSYIWNQDHGGKEDFGFIAEEINEILPEIAPKNTNGEVDGVDYGRLTPYLVEAIKAQQLQIEALQKTNESLKISQTNENKDLKKRVEELESQVAKVNDLEGLVKQLLERHTSPQQTTQNSKK